jgi:hypothetical protein
MVLRRHLGLPFSFFEPEQVMNPSQKTCFSPSSAEVLSTRAAGEECDEAETARVARQWGAARE